VSEERKLILQMVAEGKITPADADNLLAALEESERTARDAAAEQVQQQRAVGGAPSTWSDLGDSIEAAVNEGLKGLDEALGKMESKLAQKLNDPHRRDLRDSVEEKIRRSVERSVEQARRAEERAIRAAERAAERARESSERVAERAAHRAEQMARRMERLTGEGPVRIFKAGIVIDKVSVVREETLSMPAEPADCLVLDNRVGDVRVEFYDGQEIAVSVRTEAWGEETDDANERADAAKLRLVRGGSNVVAGPARETIINAVGFVSIKQTRMDYTIRVPHGTRLSIDNRAGDIVVTGARQVSDWQLTSKVGNIEVHVTPEAGFAFHLRSDVGNCGLEMAQPTDLDFEDVKRGFIYTGKAGDGTGRLEAFTKTGDIRVAN
jgi:flagellar biosynthesis GTPase FlhF